MRIAVVFASLGRAEVLCKTVDRLFDQSRQPDKVYLTVVSPEDHQGIERARITPEIIYGAKGLCAQRNRSLDAIGDSADAIVFFDDDFVPALDFLEVVEKLFTRDADLVGLTGRLVDDGIHSTGFTFEEAVERLDVKGERPSGEATLRKALYGCNMVVTTKGASGIRFDERMPLYGWLEDIDFSTQVARRGKLMTFPELTGIHLGVQGSRQPGRRLGYSQVANVIYLSRKGTMQPDLGWRLLAQNLSSNLVRSLWPEKNIDRRGRLRGNLIALGDLARGRLDPQRMLQL